MTRTWIKDANSGGFKCEMPNNVTLFAVPDQLARHCFTPKPSRGTKWRAGATHWCEQTSTATRFGRDVYRELQNTASDAQKLALTIYSEAVK